MQHEKKGRVIYWMSRDQRFLNNWALLFACHKARQLQQPLEVLFTLAPSFLGAPIRHYDFMFKGLYELEQTLRNAGIPLTVIFGEPDKSITEFASMVDAGAVVCDFSPLTTVRKWKREVSALLSCAFYEVDAHNIVPCWLASPKQEFAARTLRPKLNALRRSFLTPFPKPEPGFQPDSLCRPPVDWDRINSLLNINCLIKPVTSLIPGEQAAQERFMSFLNHGLNRYATKRNDPNANATSILSPYLHFGQISAQQIALQVFEKETSQENRDAFIEELFIRRELAENYCFYNERYDSFEGLPDWAKNSLLAHAEDHRSHCYSREQFEHAQTHDPLWNAAQTSLLETGIMHGYMRMYWAKKILEWSPCPVSALETAIALNDGYALDGRDPNGYAGIAWSIGGLHDRPWNERPVYGKIRYMNDSGCARKFDVKRYIASAGGE
jgi:deoxyribodipyrimidine photo-lyase